MIAGIALVAIALLGDPLSKSDFDCEHARVEHHLIVACDELWFGGAFTGPMIHGKPTIEIRYTTTLGTGVKVQDIALLRRDGRIYRTLWSHEQFMWWVNWPTKDGAEFYRWVYDPRRDRIIVSGTRTIGKVINVSEGKTKGRRTPLPRGIYCFSERRKRYTRC